MAWSEVAGQRTRRTKTYQDSENPQKRVLHAGLSALHYGESHTPINATPQRINNAQLDGWRVTANDWHYALGQPAGKVTDGWVGFGGRAGSHWLQFRLLRVGYLHWPTRVWQDIGSAPTYNRANLTRTTQSVTLPDDSTLPIESLATWTGIWTTPSSGRLDISWRVRGDGLKEIISINQAARTWIAANRPPATPASETFFSFVFELDAADIPKWLKNGVEQDIEGDFNDDDDNAIELRDAQDALLGLLPIDYAWVDGAEDTKVRLHKRIYRENGTTYLVIGAKVSELAALGSGTLLFDPTIDEEVAASGDDTRVRVGTSDFSATGTNDPAGYMNFAGFGAGHLSFRFTDISGLSGATIDVAYITADTNSGEGTAELKIFAEDAEAPAAPTSFGDFQGRTMTTAAVDWDNPTQGDDTNSPSIVSVIQELADSYDPSVIQIFVKNDHASTAATNTMNFWMFDNVFGQTPARLHIEYTAGGGGGTAFLEVIDETVNVDETNQRLTGLLRSIAETVNIDEVIVRARTLARLIAETVNIDETPTRLMSMIRQVAETVNIDEAINRLKAMTRTVSETVNIDEAAARLRAYLRSIDETVNIDEVNQRLSGLLRSISETVNIDETIIRARAMARIIGETVNIDEAINRLKSMVRTVGETVNIAETIVDVLTNVGVVVIRVINETVNIDEVTNRLMAMTRQIAETINIDEVIVRTRTLARVIDETLNITESVNRLKSMVRTAAETVNIGETIVDILAAAGAALVRVIDEVVNVDEVTQRLMAMTRRIDETLNISETASRAMSLVRILAETVHISEAINRAATWIRTIDETVNITETIARIRGMSRVIDETVNISETVAGILGVASAFLEATFKGMYRGMFRKMR